MLTPTFSLIKRPRRRSSRKVEDTNYSNYMIENNLHTKKWIRVDMLYQNSKKIWRHAKFLTPELFLTRYKHARGSCMYHICGHFAKWIFYCKVPRNSKICIECNKPIDESILMIQNLQKLKR